MKTLFVDDNDDFSRPACGLLEIAGSEVRRAANGLAALTIAVEWVPDLIILDIMMPELDGIEVLRRLRAMGHKAYIAMASAVNEPEMVEYTKSLGANEYVTKGSIDLKAFKEILMRSVPAGDSLELKLLGEQKELFGCLQSPPAV